jgi:hypothetical protein
MAREKRILGTPKLFGGNHQTFSFSVGMNKEVSFQQKVFSSVGAKFNLIKKQLQADGRMLLVI